MLADRAADFARCYRCGEYFALLPKIITIFIPGEIILRETDDTNLACFVRVGNQQDILLGSHFR